MSAQPSAAQPSPAQPSPAQPSASQPSAQPAASPFTRVAADRHAEAPKTLDEPVPQPRTAIDQFGLWGNLGISLLDGAVGLLTASTVGLTALIAFLNL